MNITDAERMARKLIDEHLGSVPGDRWTFRFDNAKKRFGKCCHTTKTISLSRHLVRLNDESHVRDTILHEIAHALVHPKHGHDRVWKAMARHVGARPERCYDGAVVAKPKGRWLGTCPSCGATTERHRRTQTMLGGGVACSACCRRFNFGRFDQRFAFTWKEQPRMIVGP